MDNPAILSDKSFDEIVATSAKNVLSEDQLNRLFEDTKDLIQSITPDGRFLYVNRAWRNTLGYTQAEVQALNVMDVIHPDHHTACQEIICRLMNEETVGLIEIPLVTKGGDTIVAEGNVSLFSIDQKPIATRGIFRDITARKKIEAEQQARQAKLELAIDQRTHELFASEKRFSNLVASVPGAVYELEADASNRLSFAFVSSGVADLTGLSPDACMADAEAFFQKIPGSALTDLESSLRVSKEKLESWLHEFPMQTPAGDKWIRGHALPQRDVDGSTRWHGVLVDITPQKQLQDSMRLAMTLYQFSNEAVMVTDKDNLITQVNPAFTRMTGYELTDVVGKNPSMFQSGRHDKSFYKKMWRQLADSGYWQGEIWDRRKDGAVHAKWLSVSVIRNHEGRVEHHVAQFTDITEKKKNDELILYQANYDQLTGLPNRSLFKERLKQEIVKSDNDHSLLAVLFLDVDHFKDINDTLGHDKGDELLREVSHRLASCTHGTIARLGGDEFAAILPNMENVQQIEDAAQKFVLKMSKPFNLEQNQTDYFVSVSIGIAIYRKDAFDIKNLMKHADQAMYAAKTEGRNRFCFFTLSMQQQAHEKLILIRDLRHALGNRELQVFYQPIQSLQKNDAPIKAEALLHWNHPHKGFISPAVFIPLAEQSGLIHDIGEFVFNRSIALIDQCRQSLGCDMQISVNMSPIQFKHANAQQWIGKLEEFGLPGNCINVEITEGLLLKDSDTVRKHLADFQRNGIEVAIDDFGTGFSSLSYLKKFHIEYIKIDRSFIHQLEHNGTDRALVEAIIVMAHKLGIKTVAEGVETMAQRDLLIQFGCDYAQGYFYSKPIPEDAFVQLLSERSRSADLQHAHDFPSHLPYLII
jgi:diguanylate cyclase (GGDEF)-like protein/PAS domain S-box-containing protein